MLCQDTTCHQLQCTIMTGKEKCYAIIWLGQWDVGFMAYSFSLRASPSTAIAQGYVAELHGHRVLSPERQLVWGRRGDGGRRQGLGRSLQLLWVWMRWLAAAESVAFRGGWSGSRVGTLRSSACQKHVRLFLCVRIHPSSFRPRETKNSNGMKTFTFEHKCYSAGREWW